MRCLPVTNMMQVIRRCLARKPDLVVGDAGDPYLLRWHLIPENPVFNMFLHCIRRDDYDSASHDHPWSSLSVTLRGAYREILLEHAAEYTACCRQLDGLPFTRTRRAGAGSIRWRRARTTHRLEVIRAPVWTLFITGPKTRKWRFYALPSGDEE